VGESIENWGTGTIFRQSSRLLQKTVQEKGLRRSGYVPLAKADGCLSPSFPDRKLNPPEIGDRQPISLTSKPYP